MYDEETGLYYLQSRYYNPEWGRFLNADAVLGEVGGLLKHNLFAYCSNKCVTYRDPDGQSIENCSISAAPVLTESVREHMDEVGFDLPKEPFNVINVETDADNVTTVILEARERIDEISKKTLRWIQTGTKVTTYTYKYTWEYDMNFRDSYEYHYVNSHWIETSLAIGELLPLIGAGITLTEDFLVKPIMERLPHTADPTRKKYKRVSFIKLTRVEKK